MARMSRGAEVRPVWCADFVSRVAAALVAGTIAIVANILALDAAWLVLRFRVGTLDARAELATRSSFCGSGVVD